MRAVAHGAPTTLAADRMLVTVFASPVAAHLVRYATDAGYQTVLVEPDPDRRAKAAADGLVAVAAVPTLTCDADLVVTDHHREELGQMLADALKHPARWIGVMGNPRHPGPHVAALQSRAVPATDIARVHRPVGLNIGSRTPAEIAISTLAGLIADRNSRPGGFDF
ncbi:XdhC family protein [Fodinicola feengrottensis]|uniref:XdhC family protein n=1 Tax=Fodinicola feengrottensis TaxID=435914 RepID=UPI00244341C1|nr:XdhC family protein [Fodinicola feengrottensis]